MGRTFLVGLRCLRCGREYGPGEAEYVCACRSNVGSDLGALDAVYDYDAIARSLNPDDVCRDSDQSIGRYAFLLPLSGRDSLSSLPVGNTPLLPVARLSQVLGLRELYIKDDGRNPSGSLKDRASAIAVARAMEAKSPVVATASTGNAAAALAAQCAAAGQPNVIFVPRSAPEAKIAQLLVYGSLVLAVEGTYDQAFDLCTEACHEFGWYNRNTGYNPFMTEGKKTVALEIAEQMAARSERSESGHGGTRMFDVPDVVFVSVGDGSIIGGVYKGFVELLTLGWTDRVPRIYGVQSERSDALFAAWRDGVEVPVSVRADTRADSINVDSPRDAAKALRAVRESNGEYLAVPDKAIMESIVPLARLGAVFAEPAGAAAYAGLSHAVATGLVSVDETVVMINTGSGLKDVGAAIEVSGHVREIEPTMAAVRKNTNGYAAGRQ